MQNETISDSLNGRISIMANCVTMVLCSIPAQVIRADIRSYATDIVLTGIFISIGDGEE